MNIEEIKEKLKEPEYNIPDDASPLLMCSTTHDYQLIDHNEGHKYWSTDWEGEETNRLDCFVISNNNEVIHSYIENKTASMSIISGVDIRFLKPITEEEFTEVMTQIGNRFDEVILDV